MEQSLRIALLADIHHGRFTEAKDGPHAIGLLKTSLDEIAAVEPHVIIDLGDWINDLDPATDLRLTREVLKAFESISIPLVHLLGNHDQNNLGVDEIGRTLGMPLVHRSMDLLGWHLIFWLGDSRRYPKGFLARPPDLAWLETDLASTNLPAIIFTHIPFDDGSMAGNYYFERAPVGAAGYGNAAAVRAVVERSEKVVLVVAGHVHWNAINTIDGIHYLTIQSLSETFTTHPDPAGAWALLTVWTDRFHARIHGKDWASFTLPLKRRAHHWLSRHPRSRDRNGSRNAPTTPSNRSVTLRGIRGIILDLDGVVYRDGLLLPGVREFLDFLKATGRQVVALTNHSAYSSCDYAVKLDQLGIPIPEKSVITSGWATAKYLASFGQAGGVFVIGSGALRAELLAVGLVESSHPDYVVVGYDPLLALPKLTEAARHLFNGARLIGTNRDAVIPTRDGPLPECGPVLAFLETASGQPATVVGKPNPFFVEMALTRLGVKRDAALMVGDTLETDIAGGAAAGLRTALVLTGNVRQVPQEDPPTATVPDLQSLMRLLAEAE
jgi:HAD superfamily hydrolase (TIGR01450 family)